LADARTACGEDAAIRPPAEDVTGYITFAVNTHDWMHAESSADILLRLIELYEKHGVRGDFYLTAPMTHHYAKSRPDVIRRLRDSKMTISYHVRPPHILYPGFNGRLRDLDDDALAETLRDYETRRLDMTTGELLRDQPGGYHYVAETYGRKPVALGVPTGSPRERSAARRNYRELGARVIVEHHESGTKLDRPFEWIDDLLMRPSDFSITRWAASGDRPGRRGLGNFWWNMLSTSRAADYNPSVYLKRRLAEWTGPRPPLITCLIHENNFYRARSTPWAQVYYSDRRKSRPLEPPFNLNALDASVARSPEDRQAIWRAYEEIVAYAAANLKVVTSEDIARMAESTRKPDVPDADRGSAKQREERRSAASAKPRLPMGDRPFSDARPPRPFRGKPPLDARRAFPFGARRPPRRPKEGKSFDVRLPSDGAGEGTLAVRVVAPRSVDAFRFREGAPVLVWVLGGFGPGGYTRGLRGVVGQGIVQITYNYPGGQTGPFASDGVYDYRGMNCIRATRDVIRFALGELPDDKGRRLHEIVGGPICYDNVGVLGSSSGGVMFFSTVAQFPEAVENLASYVGWENPTTGQTLLFDMGAKNARTGEPLPNPAFVRYGPKSCEMDFSDLKWDANLLVEYSDTKLMGQRGGATPAARKGALYLDNNGNDRCDVTPAHQPRQPFDRNGNGKIDADEDWASAFVAQYEGDRLEVYYSREVLDAAYEKNVFGEAGPPDFLPTPEEYKDYWKLRDSLPAFPLLKKHNPNLKVILVAGQVDHVQACPAFPGIQQAYDGLTEAGIWRRMNPDAAYIRSIAGRRAQGPIGDNDANVPIPVGQMRRFAHPVHSGVPKPVFQLAAVLELADRVHFGNEKPNLDGVLWKRGE